jgi:O-antigen/teichoic acid export membrane protein
VNKKIVKSKKDDGKNRFAWNVVSSWIGYIFVLIPGFIMPRMISDYHGTVALGIWDFMWTFVAYMKLSGIGIASSSSRYIAKYVTQGNIYALRSTVSTVFYLQLIISLFVLLCTVALAALLPYLYSEKLGEYANESALVMLFLGGSIVHFYIFDVFRGVITGSHRWDLHNLIISLNHLLTFVGMVIVLYLGGGLIELSAVYFSVTLLSELMLVVLAYKTLPEISIKISFFERKRAFELVKFGLKTTLSGLPSLLVFQTTNILVVSYLGPVYLAILARPIALLRHIETLISKYAYVLTPIAGSIQAKGNIDEIREFLITTTFYSVAFTLPVVIFLAIFGDRIVFLWMGEGFDNWVLIAMLAIGKLLPISQKSAQRILVGLNAHGKIAIINIGITLGTYLIVLAFVTYAGWSLYSAAILIIIPIAISEGIVLPIYACRIVKLPLLVYIRRVFLVPIFCAVVFLLSIAPIRYYLPVEATESIIYGFFTGGVVLLVLYWFFVASDEFKLKLKKLVPAKFG